MIEHYAPEGESSEARLLIRPNLSISLGQLFAFLALLAATTFSVAGLAWWQGNAFAPLFAVLYLAMVALCFRSVWRRGRRAEVVTVGSGRVMVRRLPELVEVFAGHSCWVRVIENGEEVALVAHGSRVDVGSFLGAAEKRQLAHSLRRLLSEVAQSGDEQTSN